MNAQPVLVDLPEDVYRRVERTAKGLRQPVPQALLRIVRAGLPSLESVPAEYRLDLEGLEGADDEELWHAARRKLGPTNQERLGELVAMERSGELSPTELQELERLQGEANRVMLKRAYACVLLKWRGYDIPKPEQL